MLRAIVSGSPEPTGDFIGSGTTTASATPITARFAYLNTTVGDTAFFLPAAQPGVWGVVFTGTSTSARLFLPGDSELTVAGAVYDGATPYVLATDKALQFYAMAADLFIGYEFG